MSIVLGTIEKHAISWTGRTYVETGSLIVDVVGDTPLNRINNTTWQTVHIDLSGCNSNASEQASAARSEFHCRCNWRSIDAQYPKHCKANSYDPESLIRVREIETLCVKTRASPCRMPNRCDASTHNTAFLIHCRIAKPIGRHKLSPKS